MNVPCDKFKDMIADSFAGILTDQQAKLLDEHLSECRDCRSYAEALKHEDMLLTQLVANINEDMSNRQERLMNTMGGLPLKQSENISTWRIIMKSPFTKLATAAVIAIIAVIGITRIGGSTPAFGEVVKSLFNVRTASFKMTMSYQNAASQDFECLYAEPIRMRQTVTDGSAIVISNLQKGKIVSLMPAQKKADVIELVNMPDGDSSQFNMFHEIRKHLQEAQNNEDESVEYLGERRIEGRKLVGYHVQKPATDITVWADPKTNLPVEITSTTGPTTYTMTDIVFNIDVDESLFSLEIPEGYKVQTSKMDASTPTEKDLIEMLRLWAENTDGILPSTVDMNFSSEFMIQQMKKFSEQGQEPSEESMLQLRQTLMEMGRGAMFVEQLPVECDKHYAGKGAKFGDAQKPIFWYKPEGAQMYRVIYADLHIVETPSEKLSQDVQSKDTPDSNTTDVSAQAEQAIDKAVEMGADIPQDKRNVVVRMLSLSEKDLIGGLKTFAQLSGGKYPKDLEGKAAIKEMDSMQEQFSGLSKEQQKARAMDVFFAAAYHDKLVRENKDVKYYGESVTATDTEKVLMRWKIAKDKYRVTMGNLSSKDVSTEELAKLEK